MKFIFSVGVGSLGKNTTFVQPNISGYLLLRFSTPKVEHTASKQRHPFLGPYHKPTKESHSPNGRP